MKFIGKESEPSGALRWSGKGWKAQVVENIHYGWWLGTLCIDGGIQIEGRAADTADEAVDRLESAVRATHAALVGALGESPTTAKRKWWWPW
jgi:hypothetical protein